MVLSDSEDEQNITTQSASPKKKQRHDSLTPQSNTSTQSHGSERAEALRETGDDENTLVGRKLDGKFELAHSTPTALKVSTEEIKKSFFDLADETAVD